MSATPPVARTPPLTGTCHCGAVHWRVTRCERDATVCNCTICRRYGAIWAYDWQGEGIEVTGRTRPYRRADSGEIEFHFCPTCGCVSHWQAHDPDSQGRTRIAVNLRLGDPARVAGFPVLHFDGLVHFADAPGRGRTVGHYLD